MTVFLGIDGGGTKTEFLLIDGGGRVLASLSAGSAYYIEIGLEPLEALLSENIRQLLTASGVAAADVTFGFLGLPAYGENAGLIERLDHIVDAVLPAGRYRCGNDVACGWAGALAGASGIAVVAGTGSIAYGEYGTLRARAGGWGELFGDEGSAFWIARELLAAFSRMSDGRRPRTLLYELVRTHFGKNADLDICATLYGPPAMGRRAIAALARLAAQAAAAGDPAALQLFERAADELAELVHAVRRALKVAPEVSLPVSYCGGLFGGDPLLLPLFAAALRAGPCRYSVTPPRVRPVAGAAILAALHAAAPLAEASLASLARTHAAIADKELS